MRGVANELMLGQGDGRVRWGHVAVQGSSTKERGQRGWAGARETGRGVEAGAASRGLLRA